MVPGEGSCDLFRRLVLVNVTGVELSDGHGRDIRLLELCDMALFEKESLLQRAPGASDAVRQYAAGGLANGNFTESHGSLPRRVATISAMIESAISSGERAPISSPTGPLILARASSSNPPSLRRARRFA